MSDDLKALVWRCDVTGNPVGTDTRLIGSPCKCQGCRAADAIERMEAERDARQLQVQNLHRRIQEAERDLETLSKQLAEEGERRIAAEADNTRLREALEPFADEARLILRDIEDRGGFISDGHLISRAFCLLEYRRAALAASPSSAETVQP